MGPYYDYLCRPEFNREIGGIDPCANSFWDRARNWFQRKDPLVLDLDDDGIETVGASTTSPILFDLDADGLKTGTGWIKGDDGFLVLDRHGNGQIDDGRELFGDATPLASGGTAADGLAALADLDANHDGRIDANDPVFTQLNVWRDLNQDGISQPGELATLTDLGITAIDLTRTTHSQTLANGNQIADQARFERTDGTESGIGTSGAADVNLGTDTFHREYTDKLPLTDDLKALPEMTGSGQVRDLREAASLSPALADTLKGLAGYHTRAELLAQADTVIAQWAATSGMQTSVDKADDLNKHLIYLAPGQTAASLHLFDGASMGGSNGGGTAGAVLDAEEQSKRAAQIAEQTRITKLIALLERFNGETFVDVTPIAIKTGAGATLAEISGATNDPWSSSYENASGGAVADSLGSPYVLVPISSAQADLLQQSYDALKQSIYDGLVLQTRLKPYLDEIALTIDEAGIRLDFSAMTADLQAHFAAQPAEAVRDLLDLQRLTGARVIEARDGLELMAATRAVRCAGSVRALASPSQSRSWP